jgi:hypothetical protein
MVSPENDTLSVKPSISITVGAAVVESSAVFQFTPSFYDYYCYLSETHDTIYLNVTGMLDGDTRYTLRLAHPLTSVYDEKIGPDDDSIVFRTYPSEREPNDYTGEADTLETVLFGEISRYNDTDTYFLNNTEFNAVSFRSFSHECGLVLVDDKNIPVAFEGVEIDSGTLCLPDSLPETLLLKVYASIRSSSIFYRLGLIQQQ